MSDNAQASDSDLRSSLKPRSPYGWQPGQSGNPAGRCRAPYDIAARARLVGPKCIDVLEKLLQDADPRVRFGAATALLDRGYGRPVQAIASSDNAESLTFLHLIAARAVSRQLADERPMINGNNPVTINGHAEPIDLTSPALE
jgi:hypothetical protein